MQEIVFRAKDAASGEWLEGSLIRGIRFNPQLKGDAIYRNGTFSRIEPVTISQYTGLCDSLGQRIFEGDRVCYTNKNNSVIEMTVVFNKGCFEVVTTEHNLGFLPLWRILEGDCVVCGDIYTETESYTL